MKAAILAGGFGKRLRPLTDTIPKPLINVAGQPIIAWQMQWLRSWEVEDVVLCVGHLGEKIEEQIGDGGAFNLKVKYVFEDEPLGTGGALKNASEHLKSEKYFITLNGDVLTDLSVTMLHEGISSYSGIISLVPLPSPYGIVEVDEKDCIAGFSEKPKLMDYWINAGVYFFTNQVLDSLPDKGNIEDTTFPQLATQGKLKAAKFANCYWRSIDSHKDIEEASKEINTGNVFG